jgi:hypothetical protein
MNRGPGLDARPDAQRKATFGAVVAHAAIPGLYAWAATVAGSAFARGTPWAAVVAGALAPVFLGAAAYAGRRWGPRARDASLWSFVIACATTWACAPATLGPRHMDWTRGASGVLGWSLFALAWAAPPLERPDFSASPVREPKMAARKPLARGDTTYLILGVLGTAAMQLVGWGTAPPERALLVRLVTLATGIAVLGAVAEVAGARHGTRPSRPPRIGLLRGLAIGAVFAALALGGLLTWRGG